MKLHQITIFMRSGLNHVYFVSAYLWCTHVTMKYLKKYLKETRLMKCISCVTCAYSHGRIFIHVRHQTDLDSSKGFIDVHFTADKHFNGELIISVYNIWYSYISCDSFRMAAKWVTGSWFHWLCNLMYHCSAEWMWRHISLMWLWYFRLWIGSHFVNWFPFVTQRKREDLALH